MSSITIHSVEVQTMVVEKDGSDLGIVLFEAVHDRSVPHHVEDVAVSFALVTENPHTARPELRVQNCTEIGLSLRRPLDFFHTWKPTLIGREWKRPIRIL